MLLSIVIPCYNEGDTCLKAMLTLTEYLDKKYPNDYEVIFVDDGSKDDTRTWMEESIKKFPNKGRIVAYDQNKGKGYAVRQGLKAADGKFVCYLDTDMATDLKFIEHSLVFIEGDKADIVMGTRRHEKSVTNESSNAIRKLVSKGCVICTKIILPELNFTDTQCGCKMMKKEVIDKIIDDLTVDGFSFDLEILIRAIRKGFRVMEIPIVWNNRDNGSKVNIVKDSIRVFSDMFYIRKETKNAK